MPVTHASDSTLLFWPLCSSFVMFYKYKACIYVYFKNKCDVVNMSVYFIAALFPETTGQLSIFSCLCSEGVSKKQLLYEPFLCEVRDGNSVAIAAYPNTIIQQLKIDNFCLIMFLDFYQIQFKNRKNTILKRQ